MERQHDTSAGQPVNPAYRPQPDKVRPPLLLLLLLRNAALILRHETHGPRPCTHA